MEMQSKPQIEVPNPLKLVASFPIATSDRMIDERQHLVAEKRVMLEGLVLQ
jgi:hypothetical protein